MRVLLSRLVCLVAIVWAAAITGLHAQQAALTSTALTPVPRLMWFNGTFRPVDHLPVAPVENITVAVYRERDGGDAIWRETQNVAMNADGRYSLLIGSTVSDGMPLALFTSGEPCWIGITVNRPGEIEQPRVHEASVPYALKAADAETLGGLPASAYLRAPTAEPIDDVGGASSSAVSAGPPAMSDVVLPGTTNFLAKYVNGADVGNSAVYETPTVTVPTGAVGIGTTTPADVLHLRFNNSGGQITGLAVQNLGNTATSYSGMLFYDQNGVLGQFQGFNNSTHEYRVNNIASSGSINFLLAGSSKFLVANTGNIGVGVAVPGSKLDVAGNINTTTQYNIGGTRVLGVAGQNIFAGVSAGYSNTSGSGNTVIGFQAGQSNQESHENTFVGFRAGIDHTNSCCNSYLGSLSGTLDSSGHNTLIGSATEFGAAGLTNATAIGARAMVSQSNSLILGSIAGENTAPADTNVGIGTSSPKTKLHVAGGSIYIANPSSVIITSPNGSCWFITVSDVGTLSTIAVTCP